MLTMIPTFGQASLSHPLDTAIASMSIASIETSPANDLERMAQLVRLNNRLFAKLKALRVQIREAIAYSHRPNANRHLAIARLDQLQAKRSRSLALLRSHRYEAQSLLAHYQTQPSS